MKNNKECVFCKIIKGEITANKIYENKKIFVFLDINPISKGHIIIIPKKHFENIYDIKESYLKEIIIIAKKLSQSIKESLGASGVNILHASGKDAQQSVSHFHIHLIPRYTNDGLDTWPKSNYKESNFEEIKNKIGIIS